MYSLTFFLVDGRNFTKAKVVQAEYSCPSLKNSKSSQDITYRIGRDKRIKKDGILKLMKLQEEMWMSFKVENGHTPNAVEFN